MGNAIRRYCKHCDDYVSLRTYFRHKEKSKAVKVYDQGVFTQKVERLWYNSFSSSSSDTEEQPKTGEYM